MKNKFVIINSLMSVVILFAILFQSAHSFEHLAKQLTEKKCLHEHKNEVEITHQHQDFDHCFVCEFTFSSVAATRFQTYSFINDFNFLEKNSYFFSEPILLFSGISYSLRGPPFI